MRFTRAHSVPTNTITANSLTSHHTIPCYTMLYHTNIGCIVHKYILGRCFFHQLFLFYGSTEENTWMFKITMLTYRLFTLCTGQEWKIAKKDMKIGQKKSISKKRVRMRKPNDWETKRNENHSKYSAHASFILKYLSLVDVAECGYTQNFIYIHTSNIKFSQIVQKHTYTSSTYSYI